MKKYNHAYSLCFSVDTDRTADETVDKSEIMVALLQRIAVLLENDELDEHLGLPFDSFENDMSKSI